MSSLPASAHVLIGSWKGVGAGCFPTMSDFAYDEEFTLTPLGNKPVLAASQKTFKPNTQQGMHFESGYFRFPPTGAVEYCVAHPFGACEVYEGTMDQQARTLTLSTSSITRVATSGSPYASQVRRVFSWSEDGNTLEYTMWLATSNTPELTKHLQATLTKQVAKM